MSTSYTKPRFSANDAALVLIDHQSGIMQLVHVAQRITKTREDAEDAVQETLLRAFVHLGDFEGRSNFRTWLTRIAINSALMILRRKRAARETAMGDNNDLGDGLRYETTDHAPNPEIRYAQTEEERILRTAVQRLRPNLRVVVQIHLQGRSMREAAEALGISLSAAKGRLFQAKKALRRSAVWKLVDQPRCEAGHQRVPSFSQQRLHSKNEGGPRQACTGRHSDRPQTSSVHRPAVIRCCSP